MVTSRWRVSESSLRRTDFIIKGRTRNPMIEKTIRKIAILFRIFLMLNRVVIVSTIFTEYFYFANTVFSRSVTRAAGSVLIFFSSSPTM